MAGASVGDARSSGVLVADRLHAEPFPRLDIIDGVAIRLDEPVAGDWQPNIRTRGETQNDRIAPEPSNAVDSGRPKRSEAGYPLWYAPVAHDAAQPGRVMFGDRTFADDRELASYRRHRVRAASGSPSWIDEASAVSQQLPHCALVERRRKANAA